MNLETSFDEYWNAYARQLDTVIVVPVWWAIVRG
jgi:hypothetical protein